MAAYVNEKLLRMKQCKARKGRRGNHLQVRKNSSAMSSFRRQDSTHHRTPIMPTPFAPLYSDGGGAVAAAGKYAHGGP